MGQVLRAVRPTKSTVNGTETRLRKVEGDVATLTNTLKTNREAAAAESVSLLKAIGEMAERLGKPENGDAHPASGLYHVMDKMGERIDGVSARVQPFEALWLQVKGGAKTLAAISLPLGALLWFLAGDRLSVFFHG